MNISLSLSDTFILTSTAHTQKGARCD